MARRCPLLAAMADRFHPEMQVDIGLLIGYDCPRALAPRQVITTVQNGPYVQRSDLGWGIVGVIDQSRVDEAVTSHRVVTLESPVLSQELVHLSLKNHVQGVVCEYSRQDDFTDCYRDERGPSSDDLRFLKIMTEGIHMSDGHYEMPLPFRMDMPSLPNNRVQAVKRLAELKNRFHREPAYQSDYTMFMNEILESDYAELVPDTQLDAANVWYIPHHGVYSQNKTSKIRVVFDCSASFGGRSLNMELLQGPPLMNNLVGVLCRFRKECVAFTCDIQKMFYQFRVNEEHRDYLRFLWCINGNFDVEPVQYRMRVHIFGAVSSPNCAGFGFRQIAADHEELGSDVADFICKDFYVDDGLKSVPTIQEAVDLIKRTQAACAEGGLKLHKFISSAPEVLMDLDDDQHAKYVKHLDLESDSAIIPTEYLVCIGI